MLLERSLTGRVFSFPSRSISHVKEVTNGMFTQHRCTKNGKDFPSRTDDNVVETIPVHTDLRK